MFGTTKEVKKTGHIVVLNAEGGVGKTSVMGQAILDAGDKGIAIPCGEDGISILKNGKGYVDLTGINQLDSVISKWAKTPSEKAKEAEDADYHAEPGLLDLMRWLVSKDYTDIGIDSITMLMPALRDYCAQVYYYDNPSVHGKSPNGGVKTKAELDVKMDGFGGSEIIGHMAKEWDKFVTSLSYFRGKGVNIYITTHRATKKGRIIGEDLEYDYSFVKMESNKNHDLGGNLYDISDAFLYGKFDLELATGKGGKGKAVGGENRVFITNSTPAIKAKNRFGMDDEIPATWEALKGYLK